MAERYIKAENIIGSGKDGKLSINDLDLSKTELQNFSEVLTSYIKSGDFAADLTPPDIIGVAAGNYNIIGQDFDSFETYLDKEILGLKTGTINITGTNEYYFNGRCSLRVDSTGVANQFMHPDTDTDDAWATISPGSSTYFLSGYFRFITSAGSVSLEVMRHNEEDASPISLGGITISASDMNNAFNKWYRFKSSAINIANNDLITFKITCTNHDAVFYMDALQLEVAATANDIKPFIRSGIVLTDGSNVKVNSLSAKAIQAYSIGVNKLVPTIGNDIDISGNLEITGIIDDLSLKETLFYKQATEPFATMITNGEFTSNITGWSAGALGITWDAGTLRATVTTGNPQANVVQDLRTSMNIGSKYYFRFSIKAPYANITEVFLGDSYSTVGNPTPNVWTTYSIVKNNTNEVYSAPRIVHRTDTNYLAGEYFNIDNVIMIDLTAVYGAGNEPTAAEMDDYIKRIWLDTSTNTYKSFTAGGWVPSSQLSGAKYRFDGVGATFYNGGLTIQNAAGSNVFSADVNGNLILTGNVTANAGLIGGFNIGATALTAGGSADGVGMSPGTTFASNVYSFWAGNNNAAAADFYVRQDGSLRAQKGSIGGLSLSTNAINTATAGITSNTTYNVRFWAGDTWTNRNTAEFRVYENGALYATSGAIGGWNLAATSLSGTNISLWSSGSLRIGNGVAGNGGSIYKALDPWDGLVYGIGINGPVYLGNTVAAHSIYPDSDNTYVCGLSGYRWSTVYTTNINSVGTYSTVASTRAVYITSGGLMGTTSSTERKKENINPYAFNYDALMNLPIVSFNYKPEYTEDTSIKYGTTAEKALELGLNEFVGYDSEGRVDYFAYETLQIANLQLIQKQDKMIKQLEARLASLEAKLNATS